MSHHDDFETGPTSPHLLPLVFVGALLLTTLAFFAGVWWGCAP